MWWLLVAVVNSVALWLAECIYGQMNWGMRQQQQQQQTGKTEKKTI